jgi:diguanylate cyclase (GGDEF)-like protein
MHNSTKDDPMAMEVEDMGESGVHWAPLTPASYRELVERLSNENQRLRQRIAALSDFEQLAYIDPLTGIGNRRHFEEHLQHEWRRWKRYGECFSVIMIDVDGFKRINDTWGHTFGDSALRSLGEHLSRAARDVDVVCRLGGDEFAIILPQTTTAGGRVLIERVSQALHVAPLCFTNGSQIRLRASFGIASVNCDMIHTSELLREADAAMYHSKRGSEFHAA